MLTYDLIAKWIEPVAEAQEYGSATFWGVGRAVLKQDKDGWYGMLCPSDLADLACAELVRRLNAAGWIIVRWGNGRITIEKDDDTNQHTGTYTIHPLEAVAKFAARVLRP